MIGLIARPYDMTFVPTISSGADANFPASNLANNDYARVVRATNGSPNSSGVAYVFDLGSPKEVDVLALLWHNMQQPDMIVHYTASNVASNGADGFGTPIYDGGYNPASTGTTRRDTIQLAKNLLTLPYPVTARYWRVEFSIAGSVTAQVSRFFVGKGAKFVIGPQKATLGAKDMNANITTEVGEERSQEDPNLIRPVVGLSFEYGRQSEMEQVLGQYTLSLGVSKPLLVCTDLTTIYLQDNLAFGRLEKVVTLESTVYDVWSFEAVVTSLGI